MSEIKTLQDRIDSAAHRKLREKLNSWGYVISRLTIVDMVVIMKRFTESSHFRGDIPIERPDGSSRSDATFMNLTKQVLTERLTDEFVQIETDLLFNKITKE